MNKCFKQSRFDKKIFCNTISNIIKYHFGDNGFELFKYYACKGKFKADDIILHSFYDNIIKNGDTTIMNLFYYAYEDNTTNFKSIMANDSIFHGFDTSSTDLGRYIRTLNGPSFLWKDDMLYCYNGKTWDNNDLLMIRYIGNQFWKT